MQPGGPPRGPPPMSGFAPRAPPLDVRRGAPGQISPTTASPPTGAVGGSSPPQRAISVPAAAAPSPARENARAKVQQAVEADVRGDYAAALKLYQEAVDGFKLQVAAEHNPTTKAYLETKMREYAARAAKLMQFLGQAPEPRTESVSPTPAGPPRQPSGGLSPDAARTTHGLSFPQTQQLGPSLTHRAQPAAAASGGPPLGGPPLGRNDPPSGISTGVNPMRAPSGSLSSRPVPAQAAPWSIPPPMQSAPSNINVLDPARDEKSTDSKPASPKLAGLLPEAGIAANEKSNISVPSKPRKGSWLLFFVKWSFLILTGWAALLGALLTYPQQLQPYVIYLHWLNFPPSFLLDLDAPERYLRLRHGTVLSIRIQSSTPAHHEPIFVPSPVPLPGAPVTLQAWHFLPKTSPPFLKEDGFTRDAEAFQRSLNSQSRVYLFFHGNAGNLGAPARLETYHMLRSVDPSAHILALEYRGFGGSDRVVPTTAGLKQDVVAAYNHLLNSGVPASQIVVVGQSLGSGLAAWLCSLHSFPAPRGLLLITPYTSIPEAALDYGTVPLLKVLRPFLNEERSEWIKSRIIVRWDTKAIIRAVADRVPVLAIHGDRDRDIPLRHSLELFDAAIAGEGNEKEEFEVEVVPGNDARVLRTSVRRPGSGGMWVLEVQGAGHRDVQTWEVTEQVVSGWIGGLERGLEKVQRPWEFDRRWKHEKEPARIEGARDSETIGADSEPKASDSQPQVASPPRPSYARYLRPRPAVPSEPVQPEVVTPTAPSVSTQAPPQTSSTPVPPAQPVTTPSVSKPVPPPPVASPEPAAPPEPEAVESSTADSVSTGTPTPYSPVDSSESEVPQDSPSTPAGTSNAEHESIDDTAPVSTQASTVESVATVLTTPASASAGASVADTAVTHDATPDVVPPSTMEPITTQAVVSETVETSNAEAEAASETTPAAVVASTVQPIVTEETVSVAAEPSITESQVTEDLAATTTESSAMEPEGTPDITSVTVGTSEDLPPMMPEHEAPPVAEPNTAQPAAAEPVDQFLPPTPEFDQPPPTPDHGMPSTPAFDQPPATSEHPAPEPEPPVPQPPIIEPPAPEPPIVEPPVSQPPTQEPPVSEPPVSEPPVSEPPVSEPLAPPAPIQEEQPAPPQEVPVPQPPTQEPPTPEPPIPEPPVAQPAVPESPVEQPAVPESPVVTQDPPTPETTIFEPPATEPAVAEPPVEHPPIQEPPAHKPATLDSEPPALQDSIPVVAAVEPHPEPEQTAAISEEPIGVPPTVAEHVEPQPGSDGQRGADVLVEQGTQQNQ